jgi:hypothetical protein
MYKIIFIALQLRILNFFYFTDLDHIALDFLMAPFLKILK